MLRKLLPLLLLCSSLNAAPIAVAEMTNKAGGKIILTEQLCAGKKSFIAYSTHPDGEGTITGCWTYDEVFFHIRWDYNGALSSFPAGSFKEIPRKNGSGI